jgi:hypothetical protein
MKKGYKTEGQRRVGEKDKLKAWRSKSRPRHLAK